MILSFNYNENSLPINIDGTTFTYYGNGNPLTTTNSEGVITRFYDTLNRITSYEDVYGNKIKYTYDESSNLTSITYPDGTEEIYVYLTIILLIYTEKNLKYYALKYFEF